MRDIVMGLILIGLGFVFGGSIFLGNFSVLSVIFDGLGIFWIVKGLIKIYKDKQAA